MMNRIKTAWIALLFIPMVCMAKPWYMDKEGFFTKGKGPVIQGFDVVSYFRQNQAMRGISKFQYVYDGGTFHFSSLENLNLFKKNPKKYLPQYGGYCAYAIAVKNTLVKANPLDWSMINDKLYLNYNNAIRTLWLKNKEQYIKQGDANWQALQDKQR